MIEKQWRERLTKGDGETEKKKERLSTPTHMSIAVTQTLIKY